MPPNPCDLPGANFLPACKLAGGIEKAAAVVDAATDPFGYMAVKLQQGALGLSGTVLPALQDLTHPDLTMEWFTSAYAVAFGLAVFVWLVFLVWNFVQLSRRKISGDDVIETLVVYTPAFFIGATFGPLIGTLIVSMIGALSDSIIAWGVNGTVGTTVEALNRAIEAGDPNEMIGGSVIALVIFAAMIASLFLAFIMLLVLLVTQYMAGVIFPLSLVWLNHPTQRSKGTKVLTVWLGICVSHVLVFFLLSAAFRMVSAAATVAENVDLKILADLGVAVIAMLVATLSPLALLKFAPVGLSSASGGGRGGRRGRERSGGGSGQRDAPDSDSQTGQMGRSGGQSQETGAGDFASAQEGSPSTPSRPGLSGKLREATAHKESSSKSMESPGNTDGGGGGDTGGGDKATSSIGAGVGTSAGSGTEERAERASQASRNLSQAGRALEASGAGAPVGVVMQAAGIATEMAGATAKVATKTADMAQDAGEVAGEHMDNNEQRGN